MQRDREIGRDRPGGGGPDDDGKRFVGGKVELCGFGDGDGEFYPDGGGDMVLVFDFGLGEGGFERNGPVNRFLRAIDEALFDESGERADDVGLVGGGLGLVFSGPIGEDAEALELLGLAGDPAFGKGIAERTHLGGRDLLIFRLELTHHLLLDGQAVAIPARNVGRAKSSQGFVAKSDVFEALVECRADVDVAVGERRSVVQDESGVAGAVLLDGVVEPQLFPMSESEGFAGGQICPHGEIGLGELKRVF